MTNSTCAAPNCAAPIHCKGHCLTHYNRLRKYGQLEPAARPTMADRFWAKVDKNGPAKSETLGACWLWTSGVNAKGYGSFWGDGRPVKATQASWELTYGPIADGMWLLHHCDTPSCVRPDHLFLGTAADNNADMAAKGRHFKQQVTHCPTGHPYDAANTRIKNGTRTCRQCDLDYKRRTRASWISRTTPTAARTGHH